MHAALGTEPMLDGVLAEAVGAYIFLWGKQPKLLPWNEPKKRPFSGTD
jgi:hypothetical protein